MILKGIQLNKLKEQLSFEISMSELINVKQDTKGLRMLLKDS